MAFDSHAELLAALVDQDVDAALFPTKPFLAEIKEQGVQDRISAIDPPFHVTRAAPALRFGLGAERERLNAVIPGYLISGEYGE